MRERSCRRDRARRARAGCACTGYEEVSPHVALDHRPQPARGGAAAAAAPAARDAAVIGLAAEPAGRRVRRRDGAAGVGEGQEERAHVRARGGHAAAARRHQQERHRGGPARQRCAAGLRGGLAAREALLHDRAAHRDRRGRPRHRRAGRQGAAGRRGRRRRPSSAAACASLCRSRRSCRRRTRRSSGRRSSRSRRSAARQGVLRASMPRKGVELHWHDAEVSFLEGVMARGGRERRGRDRGRHGGRRASSTRGPRSSTRRWWLDAFADSRRRRRGIASRERAKREPLPWAHISAGVAPDYLRRERERATSGRDHAGLQLRRLHRLRRVRRAGRRDRAWRWSAVARGEFRLRVRYAKAGRLRWLSHLEVVARARAGAFAERHYRTLSRRDSART